MTKISALERVLLCLLTAMALTVVAVTGWALLRGRSAETENAENAETENSNKEASLSADMAMFTGIGRVRAPLDSAEKPATAVLTPVFQYPPEDAAFSEELASRIPEFRQACLSVFSTLTATQAREAGEEALKETLKSKFNSYLVLGKVRELYFADFLILE